MAYSLPKYYQNINSELPREHSDYTNLQVVWGNSSNYEVHFKIGKGKYSEVYSGKNTLSNMPCVIKILKPIKKRKIYREIKILQNLQNCENIIKLLDIVQDPISRTPSLVIFIQIFENINNYEFRTLYPALNDFEIRFYIYEVLKALDYSHSLGIMHRDIKPQNIMIDHSQRKLRVIDWGLAEFYYPERDYNVRVASRYYKGPELLVNDQFYSYSLDIWSLGVMLAAIVFKKEPFFHGKDPYDQLVKISSDNLYFFPAFKISSKETRPLSICKIKEFLSFENKNLVTEECLNFLDGCLKYDHTERITAKDALNHPYFYPVERMYLKIQSNEARYQPNDPEYLTARILMSTKIVNK